MPGNANTELEVEVPSGVEVFASMSSRTSVSEEGSVKRVAFGGVALSGGLRGSLSSLKKRDCDCGGESKGDNDGDGDVGFGLKSFKCVGCGECNGFGGDSGVRIWGSSHSLSSFSICCVGYSGNLSQTNNPFEQPNTPWLPSFLEESNLSLFLALHFDNGSPFFD